MNEAFQEHQEGQRRMYYPVANYASVTNRIALQKAKVPAVMPTQHSVAAPLFPGAGEQGATCARARKQPGQHRARHDR